MHIQYEEQLREKAAIFHETFRQTAGFSLETTIAEPSKPFHYRNRIQFHIDNQGHCGFKKRRSHDVVPISKCSVAVKQLQSLFHSKVIHPSTIPGKPRKISAFATEHHCWYAANGNSLQPEIKIEVLDKTINLNLKCFFQSNLSILPGFVRHITDGHRGLTAMDLYCGTGLLGAFLADKFNQIVAVEINKSALLLARKNIPGYQHRFIPADISNLDSQLLKYQPLNLVVVNPPRNGLAKTALEFVIKQNPEELIYVSCNPVTQARDIKKLIAFGYTIRSHRLFDFYPQTAHLESVIKLKRVH